MDGIAWGPYWKYFCVVLLDNDPVPVSRGSVAGPVAMSVGSRFDEEIHGRRSADAKLRGTQGEGRSEEVNARGVWSHSGRGGRKAAVISSQ